MANGTDECAIAFRDRIKIHSNQKTFPLEGDYYYRLSRELAIDHAGLYAELQRANPADSDLLERVFGVVGNLDKSGWPTAKALDERDRVKADIIAGVDAYRAIAAAVEKRSKKLAECHDNAAKIQVENARLRDEISKTNADAKARIESTEKAKAAFETEAKNRVDEVNREIDSLKSKLTASERVIRERDAKLSAVESRAERAVDESKKRVTECDSKLADCNRNLEKTTKQLASVQAKYDADLKAARDEIERVKAEKSKLSEGGATELGRLKSELAAVASERDVLKSANAKLAADLVGVEAKHKESTSESAKLVRELEIGKAQIETLKADVAKKTKESAESKLAAEAEVASVKDRFAKAEKEAADLVRQLDVEKKATLEAKSTCEKERIVNAQLSAESKKLIDEAQRTKKDAENQVETMKKQLDRCNADSEKCASSAREEAQKAKAERDDFAKRMEIAETELKIATDKLAKQPNVESLKLEVENKKRTVSTLTRALINTLTAGMYTLSLHDGRIIPKLEVQLGELNSALKSMDDATKTSVDLEPTAALYAKFSDAMVGEKGALPVLDFKIAQKTRQKFGETYASLTDFVDGTMKKGATTDPLKLVAMIRRFLFVGLREWWSLTDQRPLSDKSQKNLSDISAPFSDDAETNVVGDGLARVEETSQKPTVRRSALALPPPMIPASATADGPKSALLLAPPSSSSPAMVPPPMLMSPPSSSSPPAIPPPLHRQPQPRSSLPSRSTTIPPTASQSPSSTSSLMSETEPSAVAPASNVRRRQSPPEAAAPPKSTSSVWGLGNYFFG